MDTLSTDRRLRRWTGLAGLGTLVLTLLVMPLHFVDDAAPPVSVVTTRSVADSLTCVCLLGFLLGVRHLVRQQPVAELLAALALVAGVVFVAVTLVADAMHVGSALRAGGGIDPTRLGGGAEAAIVLYGPTARLLTALVVASAAAALVSADLVPRPIAVWGHAVALGHLALVPTAWSGTDPANFFSINGWGVAVAGGALVTWVAASGLVLVRRAARLDTATSPNGAHRSDGAPAAV